MSFSRADDATTGEVARPVPATPSLQSLTGSVLYVFAHEDDEILILAKMLVDVKSGRAVHAVWITDGAGGGDPVQREKESRTVMKMIGVPEENLYFLGFPDEKSHYHIAAAYNKILAIANSHKFEELVSPAYEGGNIDHDVAAFIGTHVAVHGTPKLLHIEYPLYNRYQGRRRVGVFLPNAGTEEIHLKLDAETRALMLNALKVYHSQRLALWLMGIVGRKKEMLERGASYRVAGVYDFRKRPVAESCDYEHSLTHRARFAEWEREVALFLQASPQTQ